MTAKFPGTAIGARPLVSSFGVSTRIDQNKPRKAEKTPIPLHFTYICSIV